MHKHTYFCPCRTGFKPQTHTKLTHTCRSFRSRRKKRTSGCSTAREFHRRTHLAQPQLPPPPPPPLPARSRARQAQQGTGNRAIVSLAPCPCLRCGAVFFYITLGILLHPGTAFGRAVLFMSLFMCMTGVRRDPLEQYMILFVEHRGGIFGSESCLLDESWPKLSQWRYG